MAVFRVEKNKDFTIMSNYHFRDAGLSLKAKGLLSLMLSLPANWDYTLGGLASICKDGIACIRAAVAELEESGYLTRSRVRNEKGQLTDTEYVIREHPISALPVCEKPICENPTLEKPMLDNPISENQRELSTYKSRTKKSNTDISNIHQSIYPAKQGEAAPPQENGLMDTISEVADYRELIQANIEYDCLCGQYGRERMDEIMEVVLDAVCSAKPYLRVDGEDKPVEIVKSRLLKLDQFHIEYVFDCLDKNTTQIHNIRAYLLTALYNAPSTIDHYYRAAVQHDMYGA